MYKKTHSLKTKLGNVKTQVKHLKAPKIQNACTQCEDTVEDNAEDTGTAQTEPPTVRLRDPRLCVHTAPPTVRLRGL